MSSSDHVSTETLADYAEGLLRESESSAVATHLAECAECHAEELLLASLSEILAADDPGPMPEVYAARIDAVLADVARTDPVGSRSAGSDPAAGSFHPEIAYAPPAALDLTPSALAAASSNAGAGAEVVDLAARRKVVAQGLSRVTTVAASIVLLIGGTVLGLQALNSSDTTLDSPGGLAQPSAKPFARETIQPSPIRNARVPIYVGAKKNPDGSYTNPNGVVVRPDGSAVLLNGKVLKPNKKGSGGTAADDPTLVTGPQPVTPADTSGQNPGSKTGNNGPVTAIDKNGQQPRSGSRPAVDPADPTINPATPEPQDTPAAAGGTGESTAPPANDGPQAASADNGAAPENMAGPADKSDATARQDRPYVEESGSEYTSDNFAEKVLGLLDRAGYRESSVGDPVPDPADAPTSGSSPSVQSQPQFQEASVTTSAAAPASPSVAAAPSAAAAPEVTQSDVTRPDAQGPASAEVKRRVMRCARQLGGDAIAGDTGVWKGEDVTIVVIPDPRDDRQVIGHAVSGNCTADKPADDPDNIRHIQYVVAKP